VTTQQVKKKLDTKTKKIIGLVLGIAIAIGLFCVPESELLSTNALRFLGIFLAITVFMIFDTLSQTVAVLLALVAFTLSGVTKGTEAFAHFGNSTVWIVVGVFGYAAAVSRTGVLKRLALVIMGVFPETYKGSITAMTVISTILTPAIPSQTAKMGILGPLSNSLCDVLGYDKGSKPAAGMFSAAFIPSHVLCTMFMSGAISYSLMSGYLGATYSYLQWLVMTSVWGIVVLVLNWLFCINFYKPESSTTAVSKDFCKEQLKVLGCMSNNEKFAILTLVLVIGGFITGSITGIPNYVVALVGLLLMCFKGIFTSADFVTQINWHAIISVGAISEIAQLFSTTGASKWIGKALTPYLGIFASNVWILVITVCVVGFALKYIIVSTTAQLAIIFAIFGSLAAANGINPFIVVFTAWITGLAWPLPFINAQFISCLGTVGDYVTFESQLPTNYAFYVMHLAGCLASIPLWKVLGLW
jgi:DASS family divalent anion:Na+ symporter